MEEEDYCHFHTIIPQGKQAMAQTEWKSQKSFQNKKMPHPSKKGFLFLNFLEYTLGPKVSSQHGFQKNGGRFTHFLYNFYRTMHMVVVLLLFYIL